MQVAMMRLAHMCPGRSAAASGRAQREPRVVRCRPGTATSSVLAPPRLGACGGPGSAVHHDAQRGQAYATRNPRKPVSETMDALDNVRKSSPMSSEVFVEAVAYQQAAIEEMERRAYSVQTMHPIKDKRAAAVHKDGRGEVSADRV